MAEFEPAVLNTLQNEGGFFHNAATGEIVNHGVTLKFVRSSGYKPDADEDFIRNLSSAEASAIYRTYFWDRFHISSIDDQSLANKVFDLTVNMGPRALQLLQSAAGCVADGVLGPISISHINALDPVKVLVEYKELAARRYAQIAAGNPLLGGDLAGWLARLNS
jgi:lysozyme family protein